MQQDGLGLVPSKPGWDSIWRVTNSWLGNPANPVRYSGPEAAVINPLGRRMLQGRQRFSPLPSDSGKPLFS